MGWRDNLKKANEWSSTIRNTIEGSVVSPSSDIPRISRQQIQLKSQYGQGWTSLI